MNNVLKKLTIAALVIIGGATLLAAMQSVASSIYEGQLESEIMKTRNDRINAYLYQLYNNNER